MQHLPEKWLKRLNYLYIAYSSVLLLLYTYTALEQERLVIDPNPKLGVSMGSVAFAITTLIYCTLILRIFKRYNLWLAYAIGYMLASITNAVIVELTLNSTSATLFMSITYLMSILSVCLGPILVFGTLAISGVITGMVIAGTTPPTILGVKGDVVVYLTRTTIALLGLYLLRNKYELSSPNTKQNYIEKYFVTNEVVKLLTNSIGDGVIIIDNDGVVRSVNPTIETLLGKSAKDVLDLHYRSVLNIKNPNERDIELDKEPVMKAIKNMIPVSGEYSLHRDKQSELFIDLTVSAIADLETKTTYGAVIIVRDISEKKREESARSDFISTASHEMRTPVAAIEGYVELALNPKVSNIDPKARTYLEKAKSSAQHLGRLFQDLLVSAKAEDGRISNHPSVIEVSTLLEQQADNSRMVATQKNLELEFVVSSNQEPSKHSGSKILNPLFYIYADPDRIREVASNLIDNAIKYTTSGKITLGVTGDDEVVQFFVKDTGVGMNSEDVPHLFQKFYRIDNSETRTTGGTGLGLFICRKIVNLYNGKIWAESERGKGTTFYVNIPRMNTGQAEATLARQQSQTQTNPNNTG